MSNPLQFLIHTHFPPLGATHKWTCDSLGNIIILLCHRPDSSFNNTATRQWGKRVHHSWKGPRKILVNCAINILARARSAKLSICFAGCCCCERRQCALCKRQAKANGAPGWTGAYRWRHNKLFLICLFYAGVLYRLSARPCFVKLYWLIAF